MKSRKIKVAAFYKSLHPELKVTSSLRLRGEWLRQAGFDPGDVVEIDVALGCLVIRKKQMTLHIKRTLGCFEYLNYLKRQG